MANHHPLTRDSATVGRSPAARSPARPPRPDALPRVLIVGPMIGSNPGHVTTQGEALAARLAAAGYRVVTSSHSARRLVRLAQICGAILRGHATTDVLIVQLYGGRSFLVEDLATLLGRRFGLPVVLHAHGGALPQFLARYPRWARRVLSRADAVVVPSTYLAAPLSAHGAPTPQVVSNIIDTDAYPHRLRRQVAPRLFWMRSFHSLYNPLMAVRVLARVRAKHPDASLVMAGQDKGMIPAVRAEAARLGVGDAVRIIGFLDHAAKLRQGERADIFLNTNRVDNMPVAVVEACAMGLPVIATAVGGVPMLLEEGVTGLLVPDDDDAAMAKAVFRLIDDPQLAETLSSGGRTLAERARWDRVGPQWHRVLDVVAPSAARRN